MEVDNDLFAFDQSKSSHWIAVWKDATWSSAKMRPDIALWCRKTIGIPCILILKQFEAGYMGIARDVCYDIPNNILE